jgi:hypothetical protein
MTFPGSQKRSEPPTQSSSPAPHNSARFTTFLAQAATIEILMKGLFDFLSMLEFRPGLERRRTGTGRLKTVLKRESSRTVYGSVHRKAFGSNLSLTAFAQRALGAVGSHK